MKNISVLGSGGWGTALAIMLSRLGYSLTLWSPFQDEIDSIKLAKENRLYLPNIKIDDSIELTSDLSLVSDSELIIIATPSFAVRDTARLLKGRLKEGQRIVNVSKGLENKTYMRYSEVIKQELPGTKIITLSGPSHAEEVAKSIPTSLVAASENLGDARYVQDLIMSNTLRVYTNTDVIGVEIGGALKNIVALAFGICEGLGFGDNTRAALFTRGIYEITNLALSMGANRETLAGLSGLGDLFVTCTSMHSRNRRAGILIGEGRSVEQALKDIGKTVEGYHATKAAYDLAKQKNVTMPIVEQCYQILFHGKDPMEAARELFQRPKRHETEKNVQ